MALPTIQQVMSMYLYGQDTKPELEALLRGDFIRPKNSPNSTIDINIGELMDAGPGRFAGAHMFDVVRLFFELDLSSLPPQDYYTEKEISDIFRQMGHSVDALVRIQQTHFSDDKQDYAYRAFVWNTMAFEIKDSDPITRSGGAKFRILPDGAKVVEGLEVIPFVNNLNKENFDFNGGDGVAAVTNPVSRLMTDPSGIGRRVDFNFTGSGRPIDVYEAVYYDLLNNSPTPNVANALTVATLYPVFEDLFTSGVTRHVDSSNRAIMYGTSGPDDFPTFSVDTLVTINPLLGPYVTNGICYVGGGGDDVITGQIFVNDALHGGKGNDTLKGLSGDDQLYGGLDDDTYIISNDGDTIYEYAGEGKDTVKSEVSFTLGENLENLELTGSDDNNGTGNELDNVIRGNDGFNNLMGYGGKDEIHGNDGNDWIWGGGGKDQIFGGDDNDTLFGGENDDDLYGGDDVDTLSGGQNNDYLDGGDGADRLEGDDGNDFYRADSQDTIMDSDGNGRVHMDGFGTLTGGTRKESDPENEYKNGSIIYKLDETTLIVNGGLRIEHFRNGDLGIFLETKPDDEDEDDPSEGPDMGPAEQRTSPIVIDLDGDGVETVGLQENRYFDHDGNGMRERTAWASSDDGFLVRDINGNGRIDDGREMFGNQTRLANGVLAANGFAALRELDDNQDGSVDQNDVASAGLAIWRDLNSNGITDAGELQGLHQSGIKAVRTDWVSSTHVDANGQAHAQIGAAVRSDDTVAAAADVWFEVDTTHRVNAQFTPDIRDVIHLPDAQAFGNLPDLRQAMAKDAVLAGLVQAYVSETNSASRDAMLDGLIFQWAGVAGVDPGSRDPRRVYGHVMDARQLIVLEQISGRGYEGTWCWGERDPNPHGNAAPLLKAEFAKFEKFVRAQLLAQADPTSYSFIKGGFSSGYSHAIVDWDAFQQVAVSLHAAGKDEKLAEVVAVLRDLGIYSAALRSQANKWFGQTQAAHPELSPFFNIPSVIGTEGDDRLVGAYQGEVIVGDKGDDSIFGGGGNDTYYYRVGDGKDQIYDGSGADQIVFMEGIVVTDVAVTRNLTSITLTISVGASIGEIRIDNVFDESGHQREGVIETIRFYDGTTWGMADLLSRIVFPVTSGDDVLYGTTLADTIAGLGGNDSVFGLDGNDQLRGDAGNDTLHGGDGDDVLIGGTGDDLLNGGRGNDVYIFAAGFGHDIIESYDDQAQRLDKIVFEAGILPSDVTVKRDGDDLLLTLSTGDSLRVKYHFYGDGSSSYSINEIHFADSTVWTATMLRSQSLGGTPDNDVLTGYASDDVIDGLAGNDLIRGGEGNDQLSGRDGEDRLYGDGGNDVILGGTGRDQLYGDYGNDVLDGGSDDDHIQGGYGDDQLLGAAGDDYLNGGAGDDQLIGGLGNDYLEGGYGDDRYYFARGDGKDTIDDAGGFSRIYVSDLPLSEVVFRRDGSSLLIFFTSSDHDSIRLNNFFDADTGLAKVGLSIDSGEGSPWVLSPSDLDAVVLLGTPLNDSIIGNTLANTINGQAGDDTIRAGEGADIVDGGSGNDLLYGDAGDDVLLGGDGNDQLRGGDGADQLIAGSGNDEMDGGSGDDVLTGGDGNNLLDGGAGADELVGGAGDDIYVVDDVGDMVIEVANEGLDLVVSSVSVILPEHVESIELIGTANIDAVGDDLANALTGNSGNNNLQGSGGDDTLNGGSGDDFLDGGIGDDTLDGGVGVDVLKGAAGNDLLDGGSGADTLIGGIGNDIYRVEDGDDAVVELVGEGSDTVESSAQSYSLSDNIEQLILVEGSSAYEGIAGAGTQTLIGNSNDNRLDGGAGADTLIGGRGNDTYVVDQAEDVIVENMDEGTDTVESSISYTLGTTLENLTLLGSFNLDATGNSDDNVIKGNTGDNRIVGGAGDDSLYGGDGNDHYVAVSGSDRVYEYEDEGIDTIERVFDTNLVLDDNVENLILGAGITTGNGNELDNTITGNAGNNTIGGWEGSDTLHGLDGDDNLFGGNSSDTLYGGAGNDYLDGGAGVDHLEGGTGNDVYIIDSADDVVVELAGGGADQVQSSATYTLSANIENMFLTGNGVIDGTGNGLDNYIAGNSAANVINGGGGNDTIVAGTGDDTISGGTGDDKYVFDANSGYDVVDNVGGGNDGVFFTGGVTRERLLFSRNGNDLLITVDASPTPSVRVTNHFLGGDQAIDYVQPDGGFMLTTAQINQLVNGGTPGFDQTLEGSAAGEQLVGSSGKDMIRGLGGNDTLFGMAGDDTLQGGEGDDYLAGGSGNGTSSGNDRLEGGAGNDTLAGDDGNDTLIGGAGDDSYVYASGQDVIDNTGGGNDGVFFQNGITESQLGFSRTGEDLVITVNGNAANTVRVTNHFLGGDYSLDYLQPATGSMLTTAEINAKVAGGTPPGPGGGTAPSQGNDADYPTKKNGTASDEQIVGTSGRDLISGLAGNDTLFGMGGNDKLVGGDGDDYLSGGNGSYTGSGNDILIGGIGNDTLVGEDGDDTMFGDSGDDKYVYGGGADVIDNSGGGTDWILFNSSNKSVDRTRLSFHQDGTDLLIRVDGDAAQQVRVYKHFDASGAYAIDYVQPSDGFGISAASIASLLTPLPAAQAMRVAADSAAMRQLPDVVNMPMTSMMKGTIWNDANQNAAESWGYSRHRPFEREHILSGSSFSKKGRNKYLPLANRGSHSYHSDSRRLLPSIAQWSPWLEDGAASALLGGELTWEGFGQQKPFVSLAVDGYNNAESAESLMPVIKEEFITRTGELQSLVDAMAGYGDAMQPVQDVVAVEHATLGGYGGGQNLPFHSSVRHHGMPSIQMM